VNKEQAIKELEEFKAKSGISRDKAIEVYNVFKSNPTLDCYGVVYRGDIQEVKNEEFWHRINISDIRDVYTTGYTREDFTDEMVKLRKSKLLAQDKLRVERGAFNKNLRTLNALEELNKEVIESLKQLPRKEVKISKDTTGAKNPVGVIIISDVHFNEIINTQGNTYDFKIASKRLKKLAIRAKKYFKDNNVDQVVICFLGDLLNSDRRLSEVFNMVTNRSRAMVLGFYLLKQFIQDIRQTVSNAVIASVSGNEGRISPEEFCTSDILATYNYDYTIHEFLKIAFEKDEGVKFIDGDFAEKLLNINNSNVLILHGVSLKSDLEKSVQQMFGRYSANGVNIDYLFCGHYHSARIGDTFARCGSLCGGNSYSEGALNLNSRASQLIGIFYPDKTNEVLRVDLQDTKDIEGYEIIEALEEYNAKSVIKKHKYFIHSI
jgi:predicted phosphodiesterase